MDSKSALLRSSFGFRLAQIARLWRREVDEGLKPYGLTEATWLPLKFLSSMGTNVRQKDLAAALGIEGPSLVRVLDALQAADLIERVDDVSDRRAKIVTLTVHGTEILATINEVTARIRERLLQDINDREIELCMKVLDQIETTLQDRNEEK